MEYILREKTLEELVILFYTELLLNQEALGKEFQEVLDNNFWELLVTT